MNETRTEEELRRLRRCLRRHEYEHDSTVAEFAGVRTLLDDAARIRSQFLERFGEHASDEAIASRARELFDRRLFAALPSSSTFDELPDGVRIGWLRRAKEELVYVPPELTERLARAMFVKSLRKTPEDFDRTAESIRNGWIVAADRALLLPANAWPICGGSIRQAVDGMVLLLNEAENVSSGA